MSQNRDSSPVFYREIQKNAYLKRLPDDTGGKLRPLALKKPPPKPLWTQLCVHNGKTPYLEQYRDPASARAHRPIWRANLSTARHVTASVTSGDSECDFLVDTREGPVRMVATDWDTMQDWVTTLRNKLHELKIVPPCENVYCAPPAAPAPRAPARDPASPLPPVPDHPPQRVPGIEIVPIRPQTTQPEATPEPVASSSTPNNHQTTANNYQSTATAQNQHLSAVSNSHHPSNQSNNNQSTNNHVSTTNNQPTTEQETQEVDISLWDNIPSTSQLNQDARKSGLNLTKCVTNQPSMTKICGQNIWLDKSIPKRQSDGNDEDDDDDSVNSDNSYKQTVLVNDGIESETTKNGTGDSRPTNVTVIQVSNKEPPHTAIPVIGPETDVFDFEFKAASSKNPNFVNIVNTEVNVQNSNDYGTVFAHSEPEYGHLSLTTTVSLAGDVNVKVTDVNVKVTDVKTDQEGLYERLCMASTSTEPKASPASVRRLKTVEKVRKSSLPNLDTVNSDYEYLFLSQNDSNTNCNGNDAVNISSNSNINLNSSTAIVSNSTNISLISNSTVTPISTNVTTISTNATSICTTSVGSTAQNDARVNVNSVSIVDPISRVVRSNIVRTQSQNAYDTSRREGRENGQKKNGKVEKTDATEAKPIWKRGLTEFSLLTRLRGIGHGKRQDSPTRHDNDRNAPSSPAKVVHRSRPETRIDRTRRRSSSLSNGQSPPMTSNPPGLQTLRSRQAASLRSEQRRGAALVAPVRTTDRQPVFADYMNQVWVASWGCGGAWWGGRAGDRVCGVRAAAPKHAAHAKLLMNNGYGSFVDILFHRVPLGKIYVINKRDQEGLGIKLDGECNITSVESDSPAGKAKIPPPGRWAVTEVNNRPINLIKGGEEEMNRLSLNGTEVSILIQPSALVKKLRAALKGNKSLLGLR